MPTEPEELLATWYGVYLLEGGKIVRASRFPDDPKLLGERLRIRRDGGLAPEEELFVRDLGARALLSRDRRFERAGVRFSEVRPRRPQIEGPDWRSLRPILLEEASEALRSAWDPSVHLDEAVRAMADLDRASNLLGERLAGWAQRDRPGLSEDGAPLDRAVAIVLEGNGTAPPTGLPEGDPALLEARRLLADSVRSLSTLRHTIEGSVAEAAERRLPNLSALLGPVLAARLVSQAGGLERLARLPSSTVQVLGAERAFFDHLRRGSRPPRHGLLFLHGSIQGAPRRSRGRLARALAGKVSIAARLDRAGREVEPSLADAFRRRAEAEATARRKRG